ncbi:MAG: hypothetical protein QM496_02035 [Verrucomicrobiota bacterium]
MGKIKTGKHNFSDWERRSESTMGAIWRDGVAEVVEGRTPLSMVIHGEEQAARDMEDELKELLIAARVEALRAVVRFVWQGARNPWGAFKNFAALCRRTCPDIMQGTSLTQMAVILNETKSATGAREKRVIVEFMEKWGAVGTHVPGGKSKEACKKYAAVQMGNCSRRGGMGKRKFKPE